MENMEKWLEFIRGCVRPIVTISGWIAILVLGVMLALRFADRDIALTIIALITGSMTTILGFWFRERGIGK